jgi:hypothetical protein
MKKYLVSICIVATLLVVMPNVSRAQSVQLGALQGFIAELSALIEKLQGYTLGQPETESLTAAIITSTSTVHIKAPTSESFIAGSVSVSIDTIPSNTTYVAFYLDGILLGNDASSPFSWLLDTTKYTNGPHELSLKTYTGTTLVATQTVWVTIWNSTSTTSGLSSIIVQQAIVAGTIPAIDAMLPFIKKTDGTNQTIATYGRITPWTVYDGTLSQLFQTSIVEKEGIYNFGWPTPAPGTHYEHAWIINTYQETGTGNVLGLIHIEDKYDPDASGVIPDPYFHGKLGLAWSKDYGMTWKYIGDIMVPQDPDATGNQLGGPYIIKDGYMYIYYAEALKAGDNTSRGIAVARAPLTDILSAAKQGKVTTWEKYHDGTWASAGIGGPATGVLNLQIEGHTHTDAAYSTYTKKFYMLTVRSADTTKPSVINLFESIDGLSWTFVKNIATRPLSVGGTPYDGYHYLSIANTDGSDNGQVGKQFYVYGPLFNTDRSTNGFPIGRWQVNLDAPSSAQTSFTRSDSFTSTNGNGNWYYRFGSAPYTLLTNMTWNTASSVWQGTEKNLQITSGGMHPGSSSDAVIAWVAPYTGTVTVTGTVKDGNTSCGDGVIASIRHNNSQVWKVTILNGDTTGSSHNLNRSVTVGDTLYFVVNKNKDNTCDSTGWNPTIAYTKFTIPETYNRHQGFTSAQSLNNWFYQYKKGTKYTPMAWDKTNNRWQGDETNLLVTAAGQHPGVTSDSVVSWVAPHDGNVKIYGFVSDSNTTCGDGVLTSMYANGTLLWQSTTSAAAGLSPLINAAVTAGESITFEVNKRGDNSCDSTGWDPTISYY